MKIYFESVPKHYEGDYPSITIHYRPQDKPEAERIKCSIERGELDRNTSNMDSKKPEPV